MAQREFSLDGSMRWFSADGKKQLVAGFETDNRLNQFDIGIHLWAKELKIRRIKGNFLFLPALARVTGLASLCCVASLGPGRCRPNQVGPMAPGQRAGSRVCPVPSSLAQGVLTPDTTLHFHRGLG